MASLGRSVLNLKEGRRLSEGGDQRAIVEI